MGVFRVEYLPSFNIVMVMFSNIVGFYKRQRVALTIGETEEAELTHFLPVDVALKELPKTPKSICQYGNRVLQFLQAKIPSKMVGQSSSSLD